MLFNKRGLPNFLAILTLFFIFPIIAFSKTGQEYLSDSLKIKSLENLFSLTPYDTLDIHLQYPDTVIFPEFFLPIVFKKHPWEDDSFQTEDYTQRANRRTIENYYPALFKNNYYGKPLQETLLQKIILSRMDLVKYKLNDFPEDRIEKVGEIKPNIFHILFSVDNDSFEIPEDMKPQRFAPKRKYWIVSGSSMIQFSQNYFSDNWYKGGNSNFNMLSVQKMSLNYAKNKIKFENALEWRLNVYNYDLGNNKGNSSHYKLKIGEELFRSYSKLGFHAIRNWSYSANIEIKTQFITNKSDSKEVLSSLFSPLYVNMGVFGMTYSKDVKYPNRKDRKANINADISPLSIQYTYVMDDDVNETRFNVEEGKKSQIDLGSTVNAKFTMQFNKSVKFSSRFKFFTNYDNVSMESENELNMPLNRYFSTTISCYLRYDDSKTKDSDWGHFQMNEMLRFGFNYFW